MGRDVLLAAVTGAVGLKGEVKAKLFTATPDALARYGELRTREGRKLVIAADYYLNVTGELEKAAQTYQEEITSYPREAEAYGGLGNVFADPRGQVGEQAAQFLPLLPPRGKRTIAFEQEPQIVPQTAVDRLLER